MEGGYNDIMVKSLASRTKLKLFMGSWLLIYDVGNSPYKLFGAVPILHALINAANPEYLSSSTTTFYIS